MPHLETPLRYIKLPKYPHMRPADVVIWERFLEQHPDRFLRVFYDFRVGPGEHHNEPCPECLRTGWYDLTRWQIDVLAEDQTRIYVIEVKPAANAKALGQALGYAMLFRNEKRPPKPIVPVILTDHIIPATKKCAELCGVEIWVV